MPTHTACPPIEQSFHWTLLSPDSALAGCSFYWALLLPDCSHWIVYSRHSPIICLFLLFSYPMLSCPVGPPNCSCQCQPLDCSCYSHRPAELLRCLSIELLHHSAIAPTNRRSLLVPMPFFAMPKPDACPPVSTIASTTICRLYPYCTTCRFVTPLA